MTGIEIGGHNTLEVLRETDAGVYLGSKRQEDKASKDFREARANGRVLSSQVVKEFT